MGINKEIKKDFILLGKHIKNLRKQKNLTIKDVSLKTGIRKQYLYKIENGTAYGVYIDKHLLKIATVLQVKMSDLFDFKGK